MPSKKAMQTDQSRRSSVASLPIEIPMHCYLLALVLVANCMTVNADESLPAALPPDKMAAVLNAAETNGAAIYRHDHAAAIATDAAFEIRAFKRDKRVNGWITEEKGSDIIVTFIDKVPAALYRVTVSNSGAVTGGVTTLDSPTPLTAFESGAAAARALAMKSGFAPCSDKYNSVVLPDKSLANNWVVYLLPGTTRKNVVPIGGTYRVETDAKTVTSRRGFTRTCIALQYDARSASLMITHLLDPTPTEVHVFWGLWSGKPLYAGTLPHGTIWAVESGKIRLVKRHTTESHP